MSDSNLVTKSEVKRVFTKFMDDIYSNNEQIDRSRLGKILTVVDGAIADETQRKAVKDLVHDAWYSATAHRVYPQPRHFAAALGFSMDSEITMPNVVEDHNPYERTVQDN